MLRCDQSRRCTSTWHDIAPLTLAGEMTAILAERPRGGAMRTNGPTAGRKLRGIADPYSLRRRTSSRRRPADLVLGDDAELRPQDRRALEPLVRLDEGPVHLDQQRARLERQAADLGVADPARVGLRGTARGIVRLPAPTGFQPLAFGPGLSNAGSVRAATTIESPVRDAMTWFVASNSIRSSSRPWIWPYQVLGPDPSGSCRRLDSRGAEVLGLQQPGADGHVARLDLLVVGLARPPWPGRSRRCRRTRRTRGR